MTAVAQFAKAGVEAVFFSGGEVLLVPYVFKLVSFARERGMSTWLCTNGELVDEAMAQRIADSGIAGVSVSLDGASAGAHDGLRGATGAFDKALRAIRHLRDAQVEVVCGFHPDSAKQGRSSGSARRWLAIWAAHGCSFGVSGLWGGDMTTLPRLQLQLQDHLEAAKGALEASTGLSVPLSYEDPALASHFRHLNGSASGKCLFQRWLPSGSGLGWRAAERRRHALSAVARPHRKLDRERVSRIHRPVAGDEAFA